MLTCRTGKRIYQTEAVAEDALIDAHSRNNYSGSGPVAVYRCEECGYWHFTSKGAINERLALLLKNGKLNLQQEASQWEKKLKR
ncbi:MAG: hypothetical protein JST43_09890 [Bacteroidetes bacterium]|nr:hypothetical protein [Bacteroidota bacterium]